MGKEAGKYPPWNSDLPPWPPMCQGAYVECDGKGGAKLVQGGLGNLPSPGGGSTAAVFNWITQSAALPGAIGTRTCDCEAAYGDDEDGATACRACEALQDYALCDARRAVGNASFACLAPFPKNNTRHIKCTVEGESTGVWGRRALAVPQALSWLAGWPASQPPPAYTHPPFLLAGPSVVEGALPSRDEDVQDVIDIEFGM